MTTRWTLWLANARASKALASALCLALVLAAMAPPARAETLSLRLPDRPSAAPRSPWLDLGGGSVRTDALRSNETRSPLSLILLGAGLAAGGVAAYFGTQAVSATSDWRSAETTEARAAARDRAFGSATKANIGWAAAGALLLSGAGILLFTDL